MKRSVKTQPIQVKFASGNFLRGSLDFNFLRLTKNGCPMGTVYPLPASAFVWPPWAPQAPLVAQLVKNPPAMQETWVWSLGWEDPLEKEKVTHSSILAWRIPWTIGVAKSWTQLNGFHFHKHLTALGRAGTWPQTGTQLQMQIQEWGQHLISGSVPSWVEIFRRHLWGPLPNF